MILDKFCFQCHIVWLKIFRLVIVSSSEFTIPVKELSIPKIVSSLKTLFFMCPSFSIFFGQLWNLHRIIIILLYLILVDLLLRIWWPNTLSSKDHLIKDLIKLILFHLDSSLMHSSLPFHHQLFSIISWDILLHMFSVNYVCLILPSLPKPTTINHVL